MRLLYVIPIPNAESGKPDMTVTFSSPYVEVTQQGRIAVYLLFSFVTLIVMLLVVMR